jgi:hypothetical protein
VTGDQHGKHLISHPLFIAPEGFDPRIQESSFFRVCPALANVIPDRLFQLLKGPFQAGSEKGRMEEPEPRGDIRLGGP